MPPFPDGTVLQKLLQHQGDQPPDVRQFRPELPEGVSRVLAEDDGERPAPTLRQRRRPGGRPAGAGRANRLAADEPHEPHLADPARADGFVLLCGTCRGWRPVAAFVGMVVLLDLFWSWPERRDEPRPAPTIARKGSAPAVSDLNVARPLADRCAREVRRRRDGRRARDGQIRAKDTLRVAFAECRNQPPRRRSLLRGEGDGSARLPRGRAGRTTGPSQCLETLTPGVCNFPAGDSSGPERSAGTFRAPLSDADGGRMGVGTAPAMARARPSSAGRARLLDAIAGKRSGLLVVSDSAGGENVFSASPRPAARRKTAT